MTLEVDFYAYADTDEGCVKVATVRWDGRSMTVSPDRGYLVHAIKRYMTEPLFLPLGGGRVWADEEPEKYIRSLHHQYRGPMLRATEAREVT